MDAETLKNVIEKHKKWLRDEEGGERANLSGANLSRANLSGATINADQKDVLLVALGVIVKE